MPDQHHDERSKQLKALSLESAILDVAPRVAEREPKPALQPQPLKRPQPSGRVSLRPSE